MIFWGYRQNWGMFLPFLSNLPGPGGLPNVPISWLKFFLEFRLSSESIEHLIGFIAYLEPKLWLKKTIFDKNQGVSQKVQFDITGQILASNNSPVDLARGLLKHCKDS